MSLDIVVPGAPFQSLIKDAGRALVQIAPIVRAYVPSDNEAQTKEDLNRQIIRSTRTLRTPTPIAVRSCWTPRGDDRSRWRPTMYESALWGCEVQFRFPIVKLLDYQAQLVELEQCRNPVASLVLAHLAAQRTRSDPEQRLVAKLAITRRLYDLGYSAEQVRLAFGFVDWLLRLPDVLREQFVQELRTFEEERQMTYITSIEELGIEKGRAAGLLDGIVLALDLKFGDASAPVIMEVRQLTDVSLLEAILVQIKPAATLEDIRHVYAPTDNAEH